VLSLAERVPVVDPTPASPRLIAGLSSSASAGPIGCTSGRDALELDALKFALEPDAFDFGDLPGFWGVSGFFAMVRIWDDFEAEKGPKTTGALPCQQLSALFITVIARSQRVARMRPMTGSATKQSILFVPRRDGLLRCARNDEVK
jgi:hypothetical protein